MTFGNNVVSILPMLPKRKPANQRGSATTPKRAREPKAREPLSSQELAVAARLLARFNELNKTEGLTQKELGKRIRTHRQPEGIGQGLISQYLNGGKHIGVEVFLKLCRELRVNPVTANPHFEFREFVPGALSAEVIRDAAAIESLPEKQKEGIRKLIHP